MFASVFRCRGAIIQQNTWAWRDDSGARHESPARDDSSAHESCTAFWLASWRWNHDQRHVRIPNKASHTHQPSPSSCSFNQAVSLIMISCTCRIQNKSRFLNAPEQQFESTSVTDKASPRLGSKAGHHAHHVTNCRNTPHKRHNSSPALLKWISNLDVALSRIEWSRVAPSCAQQNLL